MIGRTSCRANEDEFVPMLVGALTVGERCDLERHISSCAPCAGRLRALELAASSYNQAFAGLRSRRAHTAPGRARLAAAAAPRIALGLAFPGRLLRLRLAEAALGFGVMTLAVVGSLNVERSSVLTPSPSKAVLVAPAAPVPQPEDPQRIRAARLKYSDMAEMVFRVEAGSPY
jgi:hypothetical protein